MKYLLATAALTLSLSTHATLIDFEDPSLDPGIRADGVGDFDFFQFGLEIDEQLDFDGPLLALNTTNNQLGYRHLDNVILNSTTNVLSFSSATNDSFDLNQATFASSRRDDVTLTTTAFDIFNNQVFSNTSTIGTTSATTIDFDFSDVFRVVFTATGGVFNEDLRSVTARDSLQFGIDNIVINEITPVPLPASLPFLALGLGLFAFGKTRLTRKHA